MTGSEPTLRMAARRARGRARRGASRLRGYGSRARTRWAESRLRSPASFGAWLRRGPSSRWAGFPLEWVGRPGLRFAAPSRVGVVLHVHYPELVDEILSKLESIPVPFDLIVTNSSGAPITIPDSGVGNLVQSVVLEVENHGRDILPLVAVVNADLLAPYDVVLKVHTKRSPWREDHALPGTGETWRAELLDSLLRDRAHVAAVLSHLASNIDVGLVTAPGSVLDHRAWGDNEPIAETLLRRLELRLDPTSLVFAAGSMYWVRGFVLQGLRSLNLSGADFEPESGQDNFTTAHALERLIGLLAVEAGLRVIDTSEVHGGVDGTVLAALEPEGPRAPRARVVPFFLPQFHAIDQNDAWWGPGFTEWTNVTAARPLYRGHWQPKLPRDLGFYDLSDPRVAERQERLAREAGVEGFMYYHYWFSGQPILETPLEDRIKRVGGLPFCLMWANENWTRRWDGRSDDVLLGQEHDQIPPADFLVASVAYLGHPDYLRVDGRAVLAVYRPAQIPDLPQVLDQWRRMAREAGVGDLYLLAVDVPGAMEGLPGAASDHGFDGQMGFPPHNYRWTWMGGGLEEVDRHFAGHVYSYGHLVREAERELAGGVPRGVFPGAMAGFDNTARRRLTPDIWLGANPYTFRRWLAAAVAAVADRGQDERLVFVNAWNEWAEGAMLEPSDKFGLSFLQAVRDVTFGGGAASLDSSGVQP